MTVIWGAEHTLSIDDQRWVEEVGPARYCKNREAGTEHVKRYRTDDYDQEIATFGAVVAFTRMAGVEVAYPLLDKGWAAIGSVSCRLPPDGRECGVIYSRKRTLIVNENKAHFPAVFVLMIGEFPTYQFYGWASFAEFIRPENLTARFQGHVTYAMGWPLIKRDMVIEAP